VSHPKCATKYGKKVASDFETSSRDKEGQDPTGISKLAADTGNKVFPPIRACLLMRIKIYNTAKCIFIMKGTGGTVLFKKFFFIKLPKFPLAPLQLPLLAQRLQFLGRLLGALLQLPQDLGVDEVTALHSFLELQRLEETILSSASM
jgi:hypothetical protein